MTGQILASLALDLIVPVGDFPVGGWTITGAILTVVGSVLVTMSRRRST